MTRTCQATGEAVLVPSRNRRSKVDRITGGPGKTVEDETVAQSDLSHLIAAASYCFAVFFAFSAALASRTFAFSAALALASRTFSHARTSRRRN